MKSTNEMNPQELEEALKEMRQEWGLTDEEIETEYRIENPEEYDPNEIDVSW